MTWAHLVFLNARVLLLPTTLLADYSHATVPLVESIEVPPPESVQATSPPLLPS